MKISKLFHWLYAFLIFLPITFILPTLLYYGFNDNATAQEYTKEEPIYYQTNEVLEYTDLSVNKVYKWVDNVSYTPSATQVLFNIDKNTLVGILPENVFDDINRVAFTLVNNEVVFYLNYFVGTSSNWVGIRNRTFDFVITSYASDFSGTENIISGFTSSTALVVQSYNEITYTMGITESVNQSILDTFDLPMFSWTSDNFIIAPFNYITNLFGLPNGNVVNKYLDYWLTISIVYLCFDVIMYVPLLVHRWLDKGIVE